ncbi:MAG: hypothetical protein EXS28_00080 [Pedosphaera sp.]|nr:hypothetical protein [Pedosphaera sp.]
MTEPRAAGRGAVHPLAALAVVFGGGFVVMVLEVYGARFLLPRFGSSQEVWLSQIGVVLAALAAGYYVGGRAADHWQRAATLAGALYPAGIYIFFLPQLGEPLLGLRWMQTADVVVASAAASAVLFLPPCFVLGMLAPYMIRLTACSVESVGAASGRIYAASTLGSLAGVFAPVLAMPQTGSLNVPRWGIDTVFHAAGGLTMALAVLCWLADWRGRCRDNQNTN